jgi:phage terminase small subunit
MVWNRLQLSHSWANRTMRSVKYTQYLFPFTSVFVRITIRRADNVIYSLNAGLNWINHDSQWNVNLKMGPFIKPRKQIQRMQPKIKLYKNMISHFCHIRTKLGLSPRVRTDIDRERLRTKFKIHGTKVRSEEYYIIRSSIILVSN